MIIAQCPVPTKSFIAFRVYVCVRRHATVILPIFSPLNISIQSLYSHFFFTQFEYFFSLWVNATFTRCHRVRIFIYLCRQKSLNWSHWRCSPYLSFELHIIRYSETCCTRSIYRAGFPSSAHILNTFLRNPFKLSISSIVYLILPLDFPICSSLLSNSSRAHELFIFLFHFSLFFKVGVYVFSLLCLAFSTDE